MEVPNVADAVRAELAAMAEREPGIETSPRAAVALALGRAIDDPDNSATSKSMCAARLNETLDRLYDLLPAEHDEEDPIDELRARREQREGSAKAATQ